MNYTTKVATPTAHITKKKSRIKIYNGKDVYLNNGDNFEFEIYNPKQNSVLVKIKLNGEYISTSGIVIRPGQRVFLERFLDSNNKFVFHTYSIDLSTPSWEAIQLNGDVVVEFYDEKIPWSHPHLSGGNWSNGWTTINTGSPYLGNMTFTTNSVGTSTTSVQSFYSNTTPTGPNIRSKFDTSSTPLRGSKKSIETGRIEKGDSSEQSFTNSNQTFNYYPFETVTYKIIPSSTKNKTVEEIRQYCTECGTKIKKNFKFCPSCGEKL